MALSIFLIVVHVNCCLQLVMPEQARPAVGSVGWLDELRVQKDEHRPAQEWWLGLVLGRWR